MCYAWHMCHVLITTGVHKVRKTHGGERPLYIPPSDIPVTVFLLCNTYALYSFRSSVLLALVWVMALSQHFPGSRDCALTLPAPRPSFSGTE